MEKVRSAPGEIFKKRRNDDDMASVIYIASTVYAAVFSTFWTFFADETTRSKIRTLLKL